LQTAGRVIVDLPVEHEHSPSDYPSPYRDARSIRERSSEGRPRGWDFDATDSERSNEHNSDSSDTGGDSDSAQRASLDDVFVYDDSKADQDRVAGFHREISPLLKARFALGSSNHPLYTSFRWVALLPDWVIVYMLSSNTWSKQQESVGSISFHHADQS
jgi:hypothetical protein